VNIPQGGGGGEFERAGSAMPKEQQQ